MNTSLTPVLEEMVRTKVESGYYNNASGVIRETLRLMEINEFLLQQAKLKFLQEHLKEDIGELQQGKRFTLSNTDDITDLFTALSKEDSTSVHTFSRVTCKERLACYLAII